MERIDYKKEYKDLYLPKQSPSIVNVPAINFIMLKGMGDPNREEFSLEISSLYSLSYAVKMSCKGSNVPEGYYNYTVFPLEGEWDIIDRNLPPTIKSNLRYRIMIRQPDFLTRSLFEGFLEETKKKKPNPYLDKIEFTTIEEGLCCQMLHVGSFDDEPESFKLMEDFCHVNAYKRTAKKHREIYLSNFNKTEPSRLKTVLRYQIEPRSI